MTQPLLQAADLRGAARLTTDAVAGLTSLVEAMHARIASLPRLPGSGKAASQDERTRGITGLVYRTVRGVTHVVGGSAEALLGWLAPMLAAPDPHEPPRPEREAVVAALNGVLGDHLAATDNPLAITMAFRQSGRALPLERLALRSRVAGATPRLLVLLHGLCMNDLQWRRSDHDHGEALARDLGYTPVHLHYNSGLSVSTNGRILAPLMERLYDAWPMKIERLVMLGHSMGGLVARAYLQRFGGARVAGLMTLGTPHQGSRLAVLGFGENARQMRPGSTWLQSVARPPAVVETTVIYSPHDNFVMPQACLELPGTESRVVGGVGHLAMLYSPRVAQALLVALERYGRPRRQEEHGA